MEMEQPHQEDFSLYKTPGFSANLRPLATTVDGGGEKFEGVVEEER